MTVTYYPKIATVKFTVTLRLLARWKGSLYKLVLPDVALFCAIYTTISLVYRFALADEQRKVFDKICIYVREYSGTTTVTFCLGFFVSYVLGRWWEYFKTMPWLYNVGHHIRQVVVPPSVTKCHRISETLEQSTDANHNVDYHQSGEITASKTDAKQREKAGEAHESVIRKEFEEVMHIRLEMVRLLLLSWIWMMRRISKPVLVRFKPREHLAESTLAEKLKVLNCDPFIQRYLPKLITDAEIEAVVQYAKRISGDDYDKYEPDHFLASGWLSDLVHNARVRGFISTDYLTKDLLQSFRDFRGGLGMLRFMDMFNVPLVYTQTVALCLYIYMLLNCFATQFIDSNKPDVYVPVPFILQLTFLFGWLRVSEVCLNPFGEDDDDFPTWQILNMNLETAFKMINVFDYELVEEMYATSSSQRLANGPKRTISVVDWTAAQKVAKRRISMQSGPNGSHMASATGLGTDAPQTDSLTEKAEGNAPYVPVNIAEEVVRSTVIDESERSFLIVSDRFEDDEHPEVGERHRANYEKFKRKYDRPMYQGSALENELGSKPQTLTVDLPKRAQSKVSLGVTKSRLFAELLQIPNHLASASSRTNLASSRQNLAGSRPHLAGSRPHLASSRPNLTSISDSRNNVASSKLNLADHSVEEEHMPLTPGAHEPNSNEAHEPNSSDVRTSRLSVASTSAERHLRTLLDEPLATGHRARHSSIIIPPLASAFRSDSIASRRKLTADSSPSVARDNESANTAQSTSRLNIINQQSTATQNFPPHSTATTLNITSSAGSREFCASPTHQSHESSAKQALPAVSINEAPPAGSPRLVNRPLQFAALTDSKHNLIQITETAEPQSPSSSSSAESPLIALVEGDRTRSKSECHSDQQPPNLSKISKKRRKAGLVQQPIGMEVATEPDHTSPSDTDDAQV